MARWHSANVLEIGAEHRRVWQFDARNGGFKLDREHTIRAGDPLPGGIISKDWRGLWQKKLNIAWLPTDRVFLRVLHLPKADFNETFSMVEFQLEKLSPLPVAQIVWTFHVLPQTTGDLQTLVVVVAPRSLIEEFLGTLESQSFLADRLEVPLLDELQHTNITAEGAWIFPANEQHALAAWWYNGTLQSLGILQAALTIEDRAGAVREQLAQMSWAGEMEGWLTTAPRWHVVGDGAEAERWLTLLRDGLNEPVETVMRPSPAVIAAATAQRSAATDPKTSLLPAEYGVRYHQQFVDRLWMRGVGAILALYVIGVVIYFVALQVLEFRTRGVEKQVTAQSQAYTNAIQLKQRYEILSDREALKYAALDAWKATAQLLPESITLLSLDFNDGRRLTLSGTAPASGVNDVITFNSAMKRVAANDQPLFKRVDTATWVQDPGGNNVRWNFSAELNRVEEP